MSTLLVDGDNLLMRSLHAARDSMDHDGVNTGPVVIFMNLLARSIKESEATQALVAFDHHDPLSPSLRRVLYPEYKAHRRERPEEEQRVKNDIFTLTRELLDALGVFQVDMPGLEADDLIASAWAFSREIAPNTAVFICSGDKDLLQLCDEQTTVLRPTSAGLEAWGAQEVLDHYHVPAHALAGYLGLVGDVSDNLPGVPGVGPKKAAKLLSEHDFDVNRAIDAMTSTWGEEKAASGILSVVLADLRTDPLAAVGLVAAEDFPNPPAMTPELEEILDRHALSRLRDRVLDGNLWGHPPDDVQQEFDRLLTS